MLESKLAGEFGNLLAEDKELDIKNAKFLGRGIEHRVDRVAKELVEDLLPRGGMVVQGIQLKQRSGIRR